MIDLEQRIKTALNNYCGNKDAMHVPPKDTDVDVVLSDCLKELESLKAQLAQYQSDDYVLVPKVPTQKLYRTFYDAFNSANAGNTAQCFKIAYKAMIEAQEQDNDVL